MNTPRHLSIDPNSKIGRWKIRKSTNEHLFFPGRRLKWITLWHALSPLCGMKVALKYHTERLTRAVQPRRHAASAKTRPADCCLSIRSQWRSQHFMNQATTPRKWLQRSLIAHLPDTYICKWRRRLLCKCWSAYRMTKWVVKNAMKLWSHKAWIHSQNGTTVSFHEYFRLRW